MKLSVIVSTRNRAHAIVGCLDSIAASLANAAPLDAEIVVVDNGSEDATSATVKQWAGTSAFPVRLLFEPRAGLSVAQNLALRVAQGELLAFTDDDCRLSKDYVKDLLRHDASDGHELVFRGGRVELGHPGDLPISIKTRSTRHRFNRHTNPATDDCIPGQIYGCNMATRRVVMEKLGPFDERFGTGAIIGAGGDGEYLLRAYVAGITLEYVPDMAVFHHHGRKEKSCGYDLQREYAIGEGGLYAKYFFKHPKICLPFWWDIKKLIREIISGSNLFYPVTGFSFKHKAAYAVVGAAIYLFAAARHKF